MDRHELREWVLEKVGEERKRQVELYGSNADLELGFGAGGAEGVSGRWLYPLNNTSAKGICATFRSDYERWKEKHGAPTWMHLIREEVAELFEAEHKDDQITEALQIAALCVSLVEHRIAYGDLNLEISTKNLSILLKAYDDGDGGNLTFHQRAGGWIEGRFQNDLMYEGIEIDGTLYSIVHTCPHVSVAVGREVLDTDGVWFESAAEARAYIKGLTAK